MGKPLRLASGHTKIGELIGFSTKIAVAEALKKPRALIADSAGYQGTAK